MRRLPSVGRVVDVEAERVDVEAALEARQLVEARSRVGSSRWWAIVTWGW
jgi:hypothetical protein